MTLSFTILGCGSSGGVPRVGGQWGACDPNNPKNRRRRCSLLVQKRSAQGTTNILVDTSPDLREQLIDANVSTLDAVLYTHDHADHTHGIDDLRVPMYSARKRIATYMDAQTYAGLLRRFTYCFEQPEGSAYPAILNAHQISAFEPLTIEGAGGAVEVLPLPQIHGDIGTFGFKFGDVVYSPDLNAVPDDTIGHLKNLDVWIVDALRYSYHPSHFSVDEALSWIERVKPKRSILTHLHVDLDYETLRGDLPAGVEPAYDGMVVEA